MRNVNSFDIGLIMNSVIHIHEEETMNQTSELKSERKETPAAVIST